MTLVSIRPKPIYINTGGVSPVGTIICRRQLGCQRWPCIMPNCTLMAGAGHDDDIFGYQAHWNEMRCKNNMVSGAVRDQLNYWTLDRKFASRPHLNQDFMR